MEEEEEEEEVEEEEAEKEGNGVEAVSRYTYRINEGEKTELGTA